jgi:hypothetical protein
MAACLSLLSYQAFASSLRDDCAAWHSAILCAVSWALCLTAGLCKETGITVLGISATHDWAAALQSWLHSERSATSALAPAAARTAGHAAVAAAFILHRCRPAPAAALAVRLFF